MEGKIGLRAVAAAIKYVKEPEPTMTKPDRWSDKGARPWQTVKIEPEDS